MKKLLFFLSFFAFLNADVTDVKISEFNFDKEINLIDVRMPKEYAETGVVEGAKLITYLNEDGSVNPKFLDEMNKNFKKDSKLAIMCKSGKRSAMVTKLLKEDGFTNIINLDGGMNELLKTDIKLVPYKN